MKLESLTLRAARTYERYSGYVGEITFTGPLGKVQIQTGDELSRRILEACAVEIVAAAQQVAEEMTASIVAQVSSPEAIEAPSEIRDEDGEIPY